MRLPWSNPRYLSAAAVSVVVLVILVTVLPSRLRAAANELSISPTSLRYGDVVIGQSQTLLVAVINNGQTSITISSVDSSNSKFKVSKLKLPQVLATGKGLEVSVTFAPTAKGWVGGHVTVISNASNQALKLEVGGAGVTRETVTASPASISFGDVDVGKSLTLPVLLTNTRSSKVILESGQVTGGAFSVSGAKFPLTLVGGQRVRLNATFKPKAVGLTGGSFFVFGPALNIPFTGTGSGASKTELTITPIALSFGNVAVGATETLTAVLSAGGGSVTISSASSSSSQFAVPGAEFPLTIPSGKDVLLNVTFTPQKDGKTSGTLSFTSNAANSTTSEALTGTGTAPSVSLSWSASTSPNVTGYNVYRSTSRSGSYTRINSTLDPETTYTDATVVPGKTYYYATTAVNSSGQESSYSNRAKVTVP